MSSNRRVSQHDQHLRPAPPLHVGRESSYPAKARTRSATSATTSRRPHPVSEDEPRRRPNTSERNAACVLRKSPRQQSNLLHSNSTFRGSSLHGSESEPKLEQVASFRVRRELQKKELLKSVQMQSATVQRGSSHDQASSESPFDLDLGDEKLSLKPLAGCWPGSSRKPRSIKQRLGTAPASEKRSVDAATALITEFIADFGLHNRPEAAAWSRLVVLPDCLAKVQQRELAMYEPLQLSEPCMEQAVHKWDALEAEMRGLAELVTRKKQEATTTVRANIVALQQELRDLEDELDVEPKEFELVERRTQIISQQQNTVTNEIRTRRELQISLEELQKTNKQLIVDAVRLQEQIKNCAGWAQHRKQLVMKKVETTLSHHRESVSVMQQYESELEATKKETERVRQEIKENVLRSSFLKEETVLWREKVGSGVIDRSDALTPRPEGSFDTQQQIGFQGLRTTQHRVQSLDSRLSTLQSYLKSVQAESSTTRRSCHKLVEKQAFVCPFASAALVLMGAKLEFMVKLPAPVLVAESQTHRIQSADAVTEVDTTHAPMLSLPFPHHWSDEELWEKCCTLWTHVLGTSGLLPFSMEKSAIRSACTSEAAVLELGTPKGQELYLLELILVACAKAGASASMVEVVGTMTSHQTNLAGSVPILNASVQGAAYVFGEMIHLRTPIRLLEFQGAIVSALVEYLQTADVGKSGRVLRSLVDVCARQVCADFNLPPLCAARCSQALSPTITVRVTLPPSDPAGDLFGVSTELLRAVYWEQLLVVKAMRIALLKRGARTNDPDWPFAVETTLLYPLVEDLYYIPATNRVVSQDAPEVVQRNSGSTAPEENQAVIYRLNSSMLIKQWTQSCRRVSADRLKARVASTQKIADELASPTSSPSKPRRKEEPSGGISPLEKDLDLAAVPKNKAILTLVDPPDLLRGKSSPRRKRSLSPAVGKETSLPEVLKAEQSPEPTPGGIPELPPDHVERTLDQSTAIETWLAEQQKVHAATLAAEQQHAQQEVKMQRRNTQFGGNPLRSRPAVVGTPPSDPLGGSTGARPSLAFALPSTPIAATSSSLSGGSSTLPGGMRANMPGHWDYVYDCSELLAVLQVIPLRAYFTPL